MQSSLKLAGFYGRVSGTDEDSIATQLTIARETADRDGYEIPNGPEYIFEDVNISGTTLSRGGFDRLRRLIEARQTPFDRVYVRSSDRFARWADPRQVDYHLVLFQNHGVVIRFCDAERHVDYSNGLSDSDFGHYIYSKSEIANDSKDRTKLINKLRRAKRKRAYDGFWPGSAAPYGMTRVLVDVETKEPVREVSQGERVKITGCHFGLRVLPGRTQDAIKFIYDRLEAGDSIRHTTHELNRLGFPPPRAGHMWAVATVGHIAANPIFMGVIAWTSVGQHRSQISFDELPAAIVSGTDPIVVPAVMLGDPPISREQFLRVRSILQGSAALWKKRRACSPKYLFAGKIICAVCGYHYSGRKRDGNKTYYCHNRVTDVSKRRTCTQFGRTIGLTQLESFVMEHIRNVLIREDFSALLERALSDRLGDSGPDQIRSVVRQLTTEISRLEKRMEGLEQDVLMLTSPTARARLIALYERVAREVDGMNQRVEMLREEERSLKVHLATRNGPMSNVAALLEQLVSDSFAVQRLFVEQVVEYIRVDADRFTVQIAIRI